MNKEIGLMSGNIGGFQGAAILQEYKSADTSVTGNGSATFSISSPTDYRTVVWTIAVSDQEYPSTDIMYMGTGTSFSVRHRLGYNTGAYDAYLSAAGTLTLKNNTSGAFTVSVTAVEYDMSVVNTKIDSTLTSGTKSIGYTIDNVRNVYCFPYSLVSGGSHPNTRGGFAPSYSSSVMRAQVYYGGNGGMYLLNDSQYSLSGNLGGCSFAITEFKAN